jgi:hypothetical protein
MSLAIYLRLICVNLRNLRAKMHFPQITLITQIETQINAARLVVSSTYPGARSRNNKGSFTCLTTTVC